jgi:hypothetical protein
MRCTLNKKEDIVPEKKTKKPREACSLFVKCIDGMRNSVEITSLLLYPNCTLVMLIARQAREIL